MSSRFLTWVCRYGHFNDKLRGQCRICREYRPCEAWIEERGEHCGAVPSHMYPDGPKCLDCRTPSGVKTHLMKKREEASKLVA